MMMKLWKRIAIEAFAVLGLVGDVLLMYNFGGRNCVLSLVLGLVLAAYCALVFMIALRSGQVRQARMITLRHESGDVVAGDARPSGRVRGWAARGRERHARDHRLSRREP